MQTLRDIVGAWYARSPLLAGLALAHLALFALLSVLSLGNAVEVMGVNQWVKPMKFAISIALYLGTLAWFTPVFGASRSRRIAYWIIGTTMLLEVVWIVLQGARGVRSHFNESTALDGGMFGAAGAAIALNTLALAWLGVLAFRGWRAERDGYRMGIVLGIALALVGSAVGGQMIGANGHAVGVPDGGAGLPFVNWSRVGGDLRVAHFIGLHALQVLPFIGWRLGVRALWVAAVGWAVLTGMLLSQALAGRPLWGG
jgi:hypothetical protein